MRPDYQLWLGDCLEEMDRIEAGSVDMICADLPYGTTACKWDVVIPFEPLWKQYKRVIKNRGAVVLFGSEPFSSFLRMSNLDRYKYDWIWEKNQGTRFLDAKKRPLLYHELISVFYDSQPIYNPQRWLGLPNHNRGGKARDYRIGVYRGGIKSVEDDGSGMKYPRTLLKFSKVPPSEILHFTQKPVALLSYLIKTYTNEGETVLDNTFGSCSTGEAALRTGRRFIGIEKDAGYFEIGKARIKRVAAELRGELNHLPMFAEVTT